jgi:S1-C subfamily serine protease
MEDEDYWMVSTPAYFGNSGGGVFLAETCELIGIFSKIYTHGTYQPQVITHMGLAVPINVIHDWLDEIGFDLSKR